MVLSLLVFQFLVSLCVGSSDLSSLRVGEIDWG